MLLTGSKASGRGSICTGLRGADGILVLVGFLSAPVFQVFL